MNSGTSAIVVPAAEGKMRFWRNTTVATLGAGDVATLPNGTLGYEWDSDLDNGCASGRPDPAVGHHGGQCVDKLQDYGSSYAPDTANHALTMYKHASGARVFGAGTIQWSWGLDATHDRAGTPIDLRMQQATVNLFADMNVQPANLQPGLVRAERVERQHRAHGHDHHAGRRRERAAELGRDQRHRQRCGRCGRGHRGLDGRRQHLASGLGPRQLVVHLGGVRQPARPRCACAAWTTAATCQSTPTTVTFVIGGAACPCSLWPAVTPSSGVDADPNSVELGTRFRSNVAGSITALRFYKHSQNTGTHVGTSLDCRRHASSRR